MSTDLDTQGGPPPRLTPPERRPLPRLTPPPRVTPPPTPTRRPVDGPRGSAARWLTAALFGVLVVAALAVFVVLPDWVRDRRQAELAMPASPSPGGDARVPLEPAPATPELEPEAEASEPETIDVEPTGVAESRRAPATPPARVAPPTPAAAPPSGTAKAGTPPVDEAFARAMSEGLAALDRQDFATAREAFQRAAVIQPGSEQSADGLARAEAGARLTAIQTLRQEAVALEAREDWHAARQRYKAILELDASVELAQNGMARSRRRAELDDRLESHLRQPERLSSDDVLQEASAILEQASVVETPGPRLKRQTEQLARLAEMFATPVTATLESDRLTEVMVYKVGRLGTFERRDLDLRPGTYTVVGSRRGYRDVRRKLVIEPGVPPQPLAIRCEERI